MGEHHHVDRATSSLTPSERSRATLAVLMATGVNCLLLDEPTSHLDLAAIGQSKLRSTAMKAPLSS